MTYNVHDDLWYMTSAEYAADTTIKAQSGTKAYVYETGKTYVTDGTKWHELNKADA